MSMPTSVPPTAYPSRAPVDQLARRARQADGPSIGELINDLSQDVTLLVRQEIQLAKVEMQQKLTRITTDLASLVAGGVVATLGGLALTAAVILLLIGPVGLSPWLAALIVGAVLGVTGLVLVRRGVTDLKRTDPTPRRTLDTIRDDIELVKEHRP